jgi:hypothetical protein
VPSLFSQLLTVPAANSAKVALAAANSALIEA